MNPVNKINSDIVDEALSFVMSFLNEKLSPEFVFHSKDHTRDVLRKSMIIANESGFTEEERNILAISAIFHDTGYINNHKDHEKLSAEIAGEFLKSKEIEPSIINQIQGAIAATEVPQHPKDKISKALCDADLMHLSGEDYFEQMELLRKEWKLTGRDDLSQEEFHEQSVMFFNNHHYHTEYGKKVLTPLKHRNLGKIQARISKD
jgi:HD superfamily phosphodiesterase